METEMTTWTPEQFRKCADTLGYDHNKIVVGGDTPDSDTYGGLPEWSAGPSALTSDKTGVIQLFPERIPAGHERSTLIHEITHVQLSVVTRALRARPELRDRFKEFGSSQLLGAFGGTLYSLDMQGMMGNFYPPLRVIHETLAEFAGSKETPEDVVMPFPPIWAKLHQAVVETARELGVTR